MGRDFLVENLLESQFIVHYNKHMFNILNIKTCPRTGLVVKSPEQRILSFFAMNPERGFYGREISRSLNISVGAVHAALKTLEEAKFVEPEQAGKTKLYRLTSLSPIVRVYRILNTLLALEPLVDELKGLSRKILLYGSYATGDFASSSDLDLLVVSGEKQKIFKRIEDFARKSTLDIRPLVKDQVEWMTLERESPEFFAELDRGVLLWDRPVDESGF